MKEILRYLNNFYSLTSFSFSCQNCGIWMTNNGAMSWFVSMVFGSALIGLLIMLILNDWILTEDLSETKAKLTTVAKLSKKDKNVWF